MAVCRWIAVLVLGFVASPAAAATLGVAWDPSSEPGVTGYRVYIGTWPGERNQFFDVGRFQTSFVYPFAVAGQRYYVSVATQAGERIGPPSLEVSGFPGGASELPAGQFSSVAPAGWEPAAGARASQPGINGVASVFDAGDAVGQVSSLVADPAGGALLIESGSRIRVASAARLLEEAALEGGAGERLLSIALDPHFSDTGHVFVASESATSQMPQVKVVRYRLLHGVLGEGAKVIDGVPASGAGTHLAVSDAGDIFVVQAARVLRFAADGTVPREQAGRSLWATLEGEPEAAIWDGGRNGLWVVGRTASGARASWLVRDGTAAVANELERVPETGRGVVMSRRGAQVLAHTATAHALVSIDLGTGVRVASGEALADVAFVTWTPSAGGAFVVVAPEEPSADGELRLLYVSQ